MRISKSFAVFCMPFVPEIELESIKDPSRSLNA